MEGDAVVAAGYISAAHLRASRAFAQIKVVSSADLNPAAAKNKGVIRWA